MSANIFIIASDQIQSNPIWVASVWIMQFYLALSSLKAELIFGERFSQLYFLPSILEAILFFGPFKIHAGN